MLIEVPSATGSVPVKVGQHWALRASEREFLVLQIQQIWNEQVSFEVVRAESDGKECDPVNQNFQQAVDRFGYNGKFYFASATWFFLWKDMMLLES